MKKAINIDFADELNILKILFEEDCNREFSNEDFNAIFSIAEKANKDLLKKLQSVEGHLEGFLMAMDEALTEWDVTKGNLHGAASNEVTKLIEDVKHVVDFLAAQPKPDWGTVGTLYHIHESLGEQLREKHTQHLGYSKSVEDGMKRHTTACMNLLSEFEDKLSKIRDKAEITHWKKFFTELLEGFDQILPKARRQLLSSSKTQDPFYFHTMMAGYYFILEKKMSDTILDLESSSDIDLHKVAKNLEKERQRLAEIENYHGEQKKLLYDKTKHGDWNNCIPSADEARAFGEKHYGGITTEPKPETSDQPSLREEAISLARKLGDRELEKYLEKAPMAAIKRRIKALREEAGNK